MATESPRGYKSVWRVVVIVGLFQAAWAGGFISKSSVVVDGVRYFGLLDDAMISMRYAANWADGHGLVWNPGERIEGYTNFAWTLIMGVGHLLGFSRSHTCLLVQLLGIPVLWGCLIATCRLAQVCRLAPVMASCAVVLTGAFYNLLFFSLAGMETGLVTMLVTLALTKAVRAVRTNEAHVGTVLWFAPVLLMRIDVIPVMAFVVAYLLVTVRKGRLPLLVGTTLVAAVLGAHFLWRHSYYGEWLPNTYYLKATGWPLARRLVPGFTHTLWSVVTFGLPLILALFALARRRHRRWQLLLLGCFGVSLAYQCYVGGDVWPLSRFVIPVSAGLFVLAAKGMQFVMKLFMRNTTRGAAPQVRGALTAVTLLAMNAVVLDHFLLAAPPQTFGQTRRNIRCLHAVDKIAADDATVLVAFAGVFPYYTQRVCVDNWGKCEPYIARLPADPSRSLAGHTKHDLGYLLRTYKPDVVLHVMNTHVEELIRDYRPMIVETDGTKVGLCVRRNSPRIIGGQMLDWSAAQEVADVILKAQSDSAS